MPLRLGEDPVLSPGDRRLVPRVFEKTPIGEWKLDRLPFRAFAVCRDVLELDVPEHAWMQAGQLKIHFRGTDGWRFLFDRGLVGPASGSKFGSSGGPRLLSPQTAAAITLFHDLVVIDRWTPRIGSLLLGRPEAVQPGGALVATVHGLAHPAAQPRQRRPAPLPRACPRPGRGSLQ